MMTFMLSYNELKPGVVFIWNGDPYQVLEANFLRMQQRKPVMQTRIKNLKNGKVMENNFHYSDSFAEAEMERKPVKFIYSRRDEYWFHEAGDPAKRFSLPAATMGTQGQFLKDGTEVTATVFNDDIIGIELPIKLDLEVTETPPQIKGATQSGGNKPATLETGAKVNVPMFISVGDIVRVNTQTGEYVERAEKK